MAGKKKDRRRGENGAPKVYSAAYVFPNGDKYEGEYIITDKGSLERCGTGKHMGVDGTVYDGQWSGDKMNGLGKLFHSSGARYEGNFVNNQFHGNGRYTWPNGSFFEGQFIENRLDGVGEFTDTMSQQWTGNFHYKAAPGLRFKLNLD